MTKQEQSQEWQQQGCPATSPQRLPASKCCQRRKVEKKKKTKKLQEHQKVEGEGRKATTQVKLVGLVCCVCVEEMFVWSGW